MEKEQPPESILSVDQLEAQSVVVADLSQPRYKLAGEACCDQCCDDYICSSD